jgi:iron complex transport system substrate-binding protein
VDLNAWLLDFYQNVYGVDKETAAQLRAVQWMDWVKCRLSDRLFQRPG